MVDKVENSKDPEEKRIMDVSKPGETPADATSRPVIVKHRSVMKDPMVAEPNPSQLDTSEDSTEVVEDKETSKDSTEPVSRKAAKIAPLTTEGGTDQQEETPAEPENVNEDEKAPEESADTEEKSASQNLGNAAVDALANEAMKKKKPSKEDIEKIAAIDKHIEDKTYFAPIGQISKRRAKMHWVIFIIILLLLLGAYIAIDAGLVLEDVSLPVELIK